jgi:Xaa-Pro aminopeptidase
VVSGEQVTFITDFRYTEQARQEVPPDFTTVIADGPLKSEVAKVIETGDSGTRVAVDPSQVSALERDELREAIGQAELVSVKDLVTPLRAVKDDQELEAIAAAARLADAAFLAVVGDGLIGRTEASVAWALEVAARNLGAERMSFESIVAAGPHGALPHAQPREVAIEAGQLVVIDWGVVVDGYCSDCTRTVATGSLSEEEIEVHELVDSARIAGLDAVRPGLTGREVDAVARGVITDAGFGEYFGHGLGHGVGLEIHEAPGVGKTGGMELQENMVITIEPGIYLPGRFGVRIEDLVVVKDDGCEILTGLQRELLTVG